MFGLFERKQREAAQRALDEQREMERATRRELAELALAQNFSGDELSIIQNYRATKARLDCLAMANANGLSEAESTLLSIQYQQAANDWLEAGRAFHNLMQRRPDAVAIRFQ